MAPPSTASSPLEGRLTSPDLSPEAFEVLERIFGFRWDWYGRSFRQRR
jgi:hypothetical protein